MLSFLLAVFCFLTNHAIQVDYDGPQLDPTQQILLIEIGGFAEDTDSVTVHFAEFEIPAGAVVSVFSDGESHSYKSWHHGSFQALSLDSNKAFISIELSPDSWISTKHRVIVDYLYASGPISRRRLSGCSTNYDDVEQIARASENQKKMAKAVVKLYNPSVPTSCTGFFFGAFNRVMTNHHCVDEAGDAKEWEVHVNYQMWETSFLGMVTLHVWKINVRDLVWAKPSFDAALLSLDYDSSDDFPYHVLHPYDEINSATFPKQGELKEGDAVYIIHHADGRRKMITRNEGDDECKIIGFSSSSIFTNCDREGGASGSPLFRKSDDRLIGLHRGGTCSIQQSGANDQHFGESGESSSVATPFHKVWDSMKGTQFKCCAKFAERSNLNGFQWRVCDDLPHVPHSLNDYFTSARVTPNCQATVYNDAYFENGFTVFAGTWNLPWYRNNKMSSVRFYRTNSCWVKFYEDIDFKGEMNRFTDNQAILYNWNDSWTSFKVKPGCSVEVFKHAHFDYRLGTFSGNERNFMYNHQISSFKISGSSVGIVARRKLRSRLLDESS